MRKQWVGKNVDLALLSEHVENFLRGKSLKIKKDELTGTYTILGALRARAPSLVVRILGNPNDFLIEFVADERARASIRLGLISTIFGGGFLVLRGLRSQEALEKLENEFWVYIEEAIGNLIDSAGHS